MKKVVFLLLLVALVSVESRRPRLGKLIPILGVLLRSCIPKRVSSAIPVHTAEHPYHHVVTTTPSSDWKGCLYIVKVEIYNRGENPDPPEITERAFRKVNGELVPIN